MELTVGAILEGKVKSITNFGAFISLPEGKTGMVHISEVANAYVSDIRQHLTEGPSWCWRASCGSGCRTGFQT